MVVPLYSDASIAAVLLVANRLGDVRTFDSFDLQVCETVGSSIGLSVESARVADLTRTVEGLAELNQVKDDFVAMVSHELRTPLTSIRGCVQTLLRDDLVLAPEDHHGFLRAIERQSVRLQKMIEDLLVVSRLESGTSPSEIRQVSVQGVLDQVLEGLKEAITGHALVLRLPEPLPKLRVDNYKVSQILSNLVENACKYSPAGSTITVSARADAGSIDISVENGGEGIPKDVQTRVFDRFFRVDDQGRAGPGGMGLGLYICRRLSEAIGAELRLDRSDARGTVFTLRLPLQTPASEGIRPRLAAVE
jgi:signal transduction histidine kinase